MAGDYFLTNPYPRDVSCPICEAGHAPRRKVMATIWDGEEVQYASFDSDLYEKIQQFASHARRLLQIQLAQREFRVHKAKLQGRKRWM